jgi:exodeoxyribonuclease-3
MKIISWNVNGLRAIVNKGFLDYLKKEQPDILCLQETKLQEDQIPEELQHFNEYHAYWNFAERKGYSGTVIFTKTEPIEVANGLGIPEFDTEGRTIIATFPTFVLINCYFPNGQMSEERLQHKLKFYDAMLSKMQEIRKSGKHIILCGDVNTAHHPIDLANPKANETTSGFLPIEREWLDKLLASGYVDTFRHFNQEPEQYTWWTYRFGARKRNVGWRIDYFFVNQEFIDAIQKSYIRAEILGSDHCPIGIDLE